MSNPHPVWIERDRILGGDEQGSRLGRQSTGQGTVGTGMQEPMTAGDSC